MAQFDVCVNVDATCTVLTIRDSAGRVVHRARKPPRWGLAPGCDDFDLAAIEAELAAVGYRRAAGADWVSGHWSVHAVVVDTTRSGADAGAT